MAPKKGKVNKLAKMSDEERVRYLQHRADLEEEARRRKQELISRFMNNKLQKEEAFSKTNTAKLNQSWRYILRKIKCKQMALEIQGLVSTFDFMVERKNSLLTALMKAIDDADDQHRRMIQAHMEAINQFLEIGTERLGSLQQEYNAHKNTLLEDWDREYVEVAATSDRAELELRLVLYQQDEEMRTHGRRSELESATTKNDAELTQEQRIQELTRPKELELESYWNQLRGVYVTYLDQHNPIMNHYISLREKDDFYKRDIARNADKIACMSEVLLSLQKEWAGCSLKLDSRLRRLQEEKEEASRRYWDLKRTSKAERIRADHELTVVVNASENAIERLEQVKQKMEKVQQLALICSKYETEEERSMVFASGVPTAGESSEASEYQNLDDDMIAECEDLKKLDKFLLKMNRAKVQTVCLRSERDRLARENEQLKGYMRKQLTALALNSGKERPTSMKLYKTDAQKIEAYNLRSAWQNRPVTCIEGALSNAVLHEKRMKILDGKKKAMGEVRSYPRVCWENQ